jgi:S-adenosyl methyltransferase
VNDAHTAGGRNPPEFDTSVAHNARVWNYWLGGKDHFGADREAGDRVFAMFPDIVHVARADRGFLGRAVRFLTTEAGIRQFLDIGTGLPTANNTHEVAQRLAPGSRVVYVDNDPLVLTHARALLVSEAPGVTAYIDADVHHPAHIIDAAAETLDFTQPVGVMMLGILNFVLDTAEAAAIVNHVMDAVPSGSYLVVSHPTTELGGEANAEAMRFWNEHAKPPITARTGAEIVRFFEGLELIDPGLVPCSQWRPDPVDVGQAAPTVPLYAGVARKP